MLCAWPENQAENESTVSPLTFWPTKPKNGWLKQVCPKLAKRLTVIIRPTKTKTAGWKVCPRLAKHLTGIVRLARPKKGRLKNVFSQIGNMSGSQHAHPPILTLRLASKPVPRRVNNNRSQEKVEILQRWITSSDAVFPDKHSNTLRSSHVSWKCYKRLQRRCDCLRCRTRSTDRIVIIYVCTSCSSIGQRSMRTPFFCRSDPQYLVELLHENHITGGSHPTRVPSKTQWETSLIHQGHVQWFCYSQYIGYVTPKIMYFYHEI